MADYAGIDFLAEGALPAPRLTEADAQRLAHEHFGIDASATSLGSQQDANFLLTHADGTIIGVLRVANPAFTAAELDAQDAAADHIRRYTDPVAMLSEVPAVQFALRDAAFNRGPSGAVKILQDSLGLTDDGIAGAKTKAALRKAERDPKKLLGDLRAARERYERRKRDESSKFWAGLSNRWNRQHADSLSMLA